jgi:hypothetical protein
MASKATTTERRASAESTREVVKVKSGSSPCAPTRGIRTPGPRGTAVTGGVQSPSHQHARCHAHALVTGVSRLSGGCGCKWAPTPFRIFKDFQSPNFEI